MSDIRPLPVQVRDALHDEQHWQRLRVRFGPKTLQQACHAVIGDLVDEHRVALATMPAVQLRVWLIEHRWTRDAVEARLASLHPLTDAERGPDDWPTWLRWFMDAAEDGMRLGDVLVRFEVSRGFVDRVFRAAAVPLPWKQGHVPSPSSPTFQESLRAMEAALSEHSGL